jgi:hypothetical protein
MAESGETGTGVGGRSRDAWREVGEQFEVLGRSLARALQVTWESEARRRPLLTALRQMDADLQNVIARLEREEQAASAVVKIPVQGPPQGLTAPDLPVGTLEVVPPPSDGEPRADLAISEPEE